MSKSVAVLSGALAVVAVALLATCPAQAGASASAPSKLAHTHQVASSHDTRARQAHNVGITEYSSSSARNPSAAHDSR
jgi:hypothetical protein